MSAAEKLEKFKRMLIKYLMIGLIFFIPIAGCVFGRPGPICIESDDFGDLSRISKTVQANPAAAASTGGWIDSGVLLQQNQELLISAQGDLNLCADGGVTFQTNPKSFAWQEIPGITVSPLSAITINVESGNYKIYDSHETTFTNGQGLYLKLSDTPPAQEQLPAPGSIARTSGVENFFEALPYSTNSPAVFSGTPSLSGKIYARHWDGCNVDDGCYSDNTGPGYRLRITRACLGSAGMFLVGSITDATGNPNDVSNPAHPENGSKIYFADSIGTVENALYRGTAPREGRLWLKVLDDSTRNWTYHAPGSPTGIVFQQGDSNYANNTGEYNVEVTTRSLPNNISALISTGIVNPIRDLLFNPNDVFSNAYVPQVFMHFATNPTFRSAVYVAITLAIILYALSYIVGTGGGSVNDFLLFVLRAGLILQMTSATGWQFFYDHLFRIFIQGMDDLVFLTTTQVYMVIRNLNVIPLNDTGVNPSDFFDFLGQTFNRFFTAETNLKITSLFFVGPGPLGIVYVVLIYLSMFTFFYAVGMALLLYIGSLFGLAIMFMIAPLFFAFLLFSKTRSFFTKWVGYLYLYLAQPVLLFMVLGVFNILVYSTFYRILSFSTCWGCAVDLTIPLTDIPAIGGGLIDISLCMVHWYAPWGYDADFPAATKLLKAPINLFSVLSLGIVTHIMHQMCMWVEKMSLVIFNALAGSSSGGAIRDSLKNNAISTAVAGGKGAINVGKEVGKEVLKTARKFVPDAAGEKKKTTPR